MRERLSAALDAVRSSFGFPSAFAVLAGVGGGFFLPEIPLAWAPRFAFDSVESATSQLETIATTTVSVAGLAFSVTVVAFTLVSQQLSPRVLRSFRRDRLAQWTLAALLGTFAFALTALIKVSPERDVPQLAVSVAIVLAIGSFLLFTRFVAHVLRQLQPDAVIATLVRDARDQIPAAFPAGVGHEADRGEAQRRMAEGDPRVLTAADQGYLTSLRGSAILEAAAGADALVRQLVPLGSYVLPGDPLAEVWGGEEGDDAIRDAFVLGDQRTLVQDVAFPVRQLADIALKGLSPSVNDPTTAENAMEALAGVLVLHARAEAPAAVRAGDDGRARLVAVAPSLDELLALGFDQVRVAAAGQPAVLERLEALRARVVAAAAR